MFLEDCAIWKVLCRLGACSKVGFIPCKRNRSRPILVHGKSALEEMQLAIILLQQRTPSHVDWRSDRHRAQALQLVYLIVVRLRVFVVKILYVLQGRKKRKDDAQARQSQRPSGQVALISTSTFRANDRFCDTACKTRGWAGD